MSIKDGAAPVLGDTAPDFVLPNVHGGKVRLSELRGGRVLVVFYPFAFTGICSNELVTLRDNRAKLESAGVQVLAVSCDPVPALKTWDEDLKFGFELLSDFWPHGAVAQEYGVFDSDAGRAQRGSFLIDESGVLRWSVVNEPGRERPFDGYMSAISNLDSPQI